MVDINGICRSFFCLGKQCTGMWTAFASAYPLHYAPRSKFVRVWSPILAWHPNFNVDICGLKHVEHYLPRPKWRMLSPKNQKSPVWLTLTLWLFNGTYWASRWIQQLGPQPLLSCWKQFPAGGFLMARFLLNKVLACLLITVSLLFGLVFVFPFVFSRVSDPGVWIL